jgi:two-component system response regulator
MPSPSAKPVLYADDEENDAVLLRIAFQRAGISHPIQVVTDGTQALDYLLGTNSFADRDRHPPPCLVLLDIKMPRMTGLEALERIRHNPAFNELPVVMFSSSQQTVDQERAKELGADEYLVKPASLDGFVEIARLLDQRWLVNCRGG